jgi:formylglycine-generating enzyme required for sulfatase activity
MTARSRGAAHVAGPSSITSALVMAVMAIASACRAAATESRDAGVAPASSATHATPAPPSAPPALAASPGASALAPAAPPEIPADAGCPTTMVAVEGASAADAFCIDAHEVTTADYLACEGAGHCVPAATTNEHPGITPVERTLLDPLCNARAPEDRAAHPINCVDFASASAYCLAEGSRLPSGDQWERAARGPLRTRYPWGESAPVSRFLNACGEECVAWKKEHEDLLAKPPLVDLRPRAEAYPGDDGFAGTAPMGSFRAGASPYGIFDLAGNVAEWVSDRTVRGGSWLSTRDDSVRASSRKAEPPESTSALIGFRCARARAEGAFERRKPL